ncbi:hypothetical protein KJ877_03630 [bacterium]|nr:hypothetical protein [bacterium]MBU1990600.1 hypothetical protein [bacterium]
MRWKKLGKIFDFQAINDNLFTHASNPLAKHLEGDVFRIFFSSRDKENKSSVGFVDLNIFTKDIINLSTQAIFKYGDTDSFYSHGVSIGNLYSADDKEYMLFMGWQIKDNAHWRGEIGRLRLDDNQLSLDPNALFIGCDTEDKVSLSYPWVMLDEGIYKMWYGSTISWTSKNKEMVHVIKYATSKDGETWKKHGLAVPYEIGVAQAFSRPSVIRDARAYHMWYSYRSGEGSKYKIGYAHSADGVNWVRKNSLGLGVSDYGWDCEMVCYPFVFEHKNNMYMLYNGNAYGKTGFGLAIWEHS